MKLTEPKVFLIGETKILHENLLEYLKEMNAEGWASVAPSDGELLIEVYGRLCYDSFIPGNNLNVSKVREGNDVYLKNILDVNHGCYDEKTDVLTINGWKNWKEITEQDELATLNKDGFIEYHKPEKLISTFYSGKMYKVDSSQVDLFVTPNHNMFVCLTTTKEGRKKENYTFIKADILNNKSHAYLKTGKHNFYDKEKSFCSGIFKLLGFAIGDGHISSSNTIYFHLKKDRKISWLLNLCKENNFKCFIKDNDYYNIPIDKKYISLFKNIYNDKKEKRIPINISKTNLENLKSLFEGLLESDGCITETGILYDTTSYELANQIQQLCLHLGLAANISQAEYYKNRENSYGTKPIYRLSIIERCLKPIVNKYKETKSMSYWVDDWEGMVYCAQVPNNTLYVRRNGKPVWCGNSVLEHSMCNFIFMNVSKIFTEELVRHRVGVAISGQSGRYVRRNETHIWIPDILTKEHPYMVSILNFMLAIFDRWIAFSAENYGLNDAKLPFYKKKLFTSAIRRFLPIGTSSNMGWSANFRALGHVISMRTSPGAEIEMQIVFNKVAEICIERYPNVFQNCKKTLLTDTYQDQELYHYNFNEN